MATGSRDTLRLEVFIATEKNSGCWKILQYAYRLYGSKVSGGHVRYLREELADLLRWRAHVAREHRSEGRHEVGPLAIVQRLLPLHAAVQCVEFQLQSINSPLIYVLD